MKKIEIPNGSVFGRLTVIKEVDAVKKMRTFHCKCVCGNEVFRSGKTLRTHDNSSCGCFQTEYNNSPKPQKRTENYGHVGTRLYEIWIGIKKRCKNQNHRSYKWYGAKGVKICKEWDERFMNFYNWANSNGYLETLTIDRKDCDGNYEPNNCRWVAKSFQNNNKSDNRFEIFNNEKLTIAQISKITHIPYQTIIGRLNRGWTIEKATK